MKPDITLFDCSHLPEHLREVSEKFRELALMLSELVPNSCACSGGVAAEKATALRKLLESKDAAVRTVVLVGKEKEKEASAQAAVDLWNRENKIGAAVRYWCGAREGEPSRGQTSSEAYILGGHTAGVHVPCAGFIALSHVERGVDDDAA